MENYDKIKKHSNLILEENPEYLDFIFIHLDRISTPT